MICKSALFLIFCWCHSLSLTDLYNHRVQNIDGKTLSLENYRGYVTLIVNVASECGYTESHYEELVKLKKQLHTYSDVFEILAFPCNQFGQQEPSSNQDILAFAQDKFNVNFPIFSKIDVTGPSAHPMYKDLTVQWGKAPDWNFWKYLVDRNGIVIKGWGPRVSVASITETIIEHVTAAALAKKSEL